MTNADFRPPTLWSMLREPQPHTFVRSIASLSAGCLMAAMGLFAAQLATEFLFVDSWWWRHNFHVIGLAAASVVWLLALRLIWTPVRGLGQLVRPIFSTLSIAACASLLAALAHDDPLVAIIVLLAVAATLYCWASAYVRWIGGRMFARENPIDVRCPHCRYSMVGLTECRCPECGSVWTIDTLIAAQDCAAAGTGTETQPAPASDPTDAAIPGQLATA